MLHKLKSVCIVYVCMLAHKSLTLLFECPRQEQLKFVHSSPSTQNDIFEKWKILSLLSLYVSCIVLSHSYIIYRKNYCYFFVLFCFVFDGFSRVKFKNEKKKSVCVSFLYHQQEYEVMDGTELIFISKMLLYPSKSYLRVEIWCRNLAMLYLRHFHDCIFANIASYAQN